MKKSVILLLLIATVARLCAQQPGSIDVSFNSSDVGYGLWDGANAPIEVSVVQADGKILIGGGFSSYGAHWVNRMARLNPDGSIDSSFNAYLPEEVKSISAIFVQHDGRILIGGRQGFNDFYLARLYADGSFDPGFNPSISDYGSVQTIVMQEDGKILVGGYFGSFDSPGIERFFPDGTLDPSFNAGDNLWVTTIALQQDGKIIIGGPFNYYNLIEVNNIARLNPDGSLDTSFNTGSGFQIGTTPNPGTNTSKIQIVENEKILICGSFDNYNGIPVKGIVRLNPDGSIDSSFNSHFNNYFRLDLTSFLGQSNGKIVVSGDFKETQWSSFETKTVRLNSDGTYDPTFEIPPLEYENNDGRSYRIMTMNEKPEGRILISGGFTSFNGIGRNSIARLNDDGSLDLSFSTGMGTGAKNTIAASCLQADGKIIIGGAFTWYNGVIRKKLARLHSDGSVDLGFSSGVGANNVVSAVAVQSDGKILVGGTFTSYSGFARNGLVRLNSDGSVDENFVPFMNSGSVNCILVQPDGKIVIGGNFGTTKNCMRLQANGSADVGFNSLNNSNYEVFAALLQTDGKIIIGGNFSFFNGAPRNHLARLNEDGSLDPAFDPNINSNAFVTCLAMQNNSKILVGGGFLGGGGFLTRLLPDGLSDSSFTAAGNPDNIVKTLIAQPDGKIIIAGAFTGYQTSQRNYIARLNNNGSLDPNFTIGLGANNIIETALMQPDGKVILAGSFTAYDTFGRNRMARIYGYDTLSLTEFETADSVFFSPNPSRERVSFSPNTRSVNLFSLEGKQIPSKLENNELDLSSLTQGVYLIQITTDQDRRVIRRLVKI